MVGKKRNALRDYHLLVMRLPAGGFGWQIRYGKGAKPVQASLEAYATRGESEIRGTEVLAKLRREAEAES